MIELRYRGAGWDQKQFLLNPEYIETVNADGAHCNIFTIGGDDSYKVFESYDEVK